VITTEIAEQRQQLQTASLSETAMACADARARIRLYVRERDGAAFAFLRNVLLALRDWLVHGVAPLPQQFWRRQEDWSVALGNLQGCARVVGEAFSGSVGGYSGEALCPVYEALRLLKSDAAIAESCTRTSKLFDKLSGATEL
jgi:hypothetical protein